MPGFWTHAKARRREVNLGVEDAAAEILTRSRRGYFYDIQNAFKSGRQLEMVGVTEASAAIGGIKAAIDIAKGIGSLKSEAERNHAVIEIQRSLLDAQAAAFDDKQTIAALVSKAEKLERQIQTATTWEVEKARYVLTKSELGAYTYDLKPEFSHSETLHRLCVTCFEDGKKSILHTTNKHSGGEQVTCGRCKNQLQLAKFVHQSIPNQSRGFY